MLDQCFEDFKELKIKVTPSSMLFKFDNNPWYTFDKRGFITTAIQNMEY